MSPTLPSPQKPPGATVEPTLEVPARLASGSRPPSHVPASVRTAFSLISLVRLAPSWLFSLVAHTAILLMMALVPLTSDIRPTSMTVILGNDSGGDGLDGDLGTSTDFTLSDSSETDSREETTAPQLSDLAEWIEPTWQSDALESIELSGELASQTSTQSVSESLASSLAQSLSGRQPNQRGMMLGLGGGSGATESAVEAGLEWLAQRQHSEGYWSLNGQSRSKNVRFSSGGINENRTGATAMALNAFLGAGYTHTEGKYRGIVRRGLEYLLERQSSNGFFAGGEPNQQQAYAQAIATISILEAYGLTGDPSLVEPAKRALQYAQWAQSPKGGWRYEPRADSDVSVTGWFVMALETGKMVGFEIDESVLERVSGYLDSVSHHEKSAYSYNDIQKPDLSMTAEGLLCRMLLGWPRSEEALQVGVEELARNPPDQDSTQQSVYFWYYATQVLHHYGGREWSKWNNEMKRVLPALQEQSGPEKGSWSPDRDWYGVPGGRLYTTCLCIYSLEVYYRHLAIYSAK